MRVLVMLMITCVVLTILFYSLGGTLEGMICGLGTLILWGIFNAVIELKKEIRKKREEEK